MGSILIKGGQELEVMHRSLTPTALKEYDSPVFNKKGSLCNNQADHNTGLVIGSGNA